MPPADRRDHKRGVLKLISMKENQKPNLFTQFFQILKISDIVLAMLFYILGAGIVRMNGAVISWFGFFIGLICVLAIFSAMPFLESRFSRIQYSVIPDKNGSRRSLTSTNQLQIGLGFLAITAFFIVFLSVRQGLSISAGLIFFLIFLLILFMVVPPIRLIQKGLAEVPFAILVGNLVPGFAYFLQTSEYSRNLLSVTLPLTLLILANRLAISLENYEKNPDLLRKTMMESIGWRRGISFHNLIIFAAFLLMVIFGIIGQPWKLTWPGLLVLPLGIYEIWQLWKISQGAKPHWRILKLTSFGMIFLAAYFISLTAWIR